MDNKFYTFFLGLLLLVSLCSTTVTADQWIYGKSTVTFKDYKFSETDHISFFISNFDSLVMTNSSFTGNIKIFIDASTPFTKGKIPSVLITGSRFDGKTKADPDHPDVFYSKAQVWLYGGPNAYPFHTAISDNTWFDSFLVVANTTMPRNFLFPFIFSNNKFIKLSQVKAWDFGYNNISCPGWNENIFDADHSYLATQLMFCGVTTLSGGVHIKDSEFTQQGEFLGVQPTNIFFSDDLVLNSQSVIVLENNHLTILSDSGTPVLLKGHITLHDGAQLMMKENNIGQRGGNAIYLVSGATLDKNSYMLLISNTLSSPEGDGVVFDGPVSLSASTVLIDGNTFSLRGDYGTGMVFSDFTANNKANVSIIGNTFNSVHFVLNPLSFHLSGASTFALKENKITLDATGAFGGSVISSFDTDPAAGNQVRVLGTNMTAIENSKFQVDKNTMEYVEVAKKSTTANAALSFFAMRVAVRSGASVNIVRNDMTCKKNGDADNTDLSLKCDVFTGSVDEDESSKVSLHCNQYNDELLSTWSCLANNKNTLGTQDTSAVEESVSTRITEFCPPLAYYHEGIVGVESEDRHADPYMVEEKGFPAERAQSVHYYPNGNGHWRDGNVQVGVEVSLLDLRGSSKAETNRKHLMKPCGAKTGRACPVSCAMPTNCSGYGNQLLQGYVYSAITSGNSFAQLEEASVSDPLSPAKHNCSVENSFAVADAVAFSKNPAVVFHCYKDGTIRIFGTGNDNKHGLFLVWEGISGVPDAYLGATFVCSPCLPIAESSLNPQPIAVLVIAIIKSVLVVYVCIHVSKKWKLIPGILLNSFAKVKQEYWHSASTTSSGISEVMYPDEISLAQLEERLQQIIFDFKHHNATQGSDDVKQKTSSVTTKGAVPLPQGFVAFYAENLTFGGLRIPVVNCTSEVAATVVGMLNVYERWMPSELDTVSFVGETTSLHSPKHEDALINASSSKKGEREEEAGATSGYQQQSSEEVAAGEHPDKVQQGSGVTMSDVALVYKFTNMSTLEAAVEEARRILLRYIDGPQLQRVVMSSHKVRVCYIPPAWVLDVNAVAVAILFVTSISDAYVVAPNRYTWIYFRLFNSTITATLLANAAIRSLTTQRMTFRRLYAQKHICFVLVILFPALFSHVFVGAIVYCWAVLPILLGGIAVELCVNHLMPKATEHSALLAAAAAAAHKKRSLSTKLRERIALLAFEYTIVEHMFRMVGRLALIASVVASLSLVFNWTQAFVYFHNDIQSHSSTVSESGYGTVVGAMFHDAHARTNVCTVQEIGDTISQWWMTMASLFGPF